ncbi:hypothetical protein TH66_19975 [Carbonactinospora thermoautotrophica]|uniref:Uncharacterized protein n=1 Tax=Carbonactinospora thermoautotrophica TaxID=1469144 RepID=A0A132MJ10_9ACTN|nr:hypothetical protein [Carbonactinospora thermoautotrophica]KWW97755.1 hypothetical protein TH66_19975 [Carbonactinospora thermoautotrophica]KWX06242.1 hypothetical protein TR74_22655 [Carbonactinospora thermoautotrophica]
MQLTIEHLAPAVLGLQDGELDPGFEDVPAPIQAIFEAVNVINTRVPDPDAVDLVVTGDFVVSVQARSGDPHEAEHFDTVRGSGMAAAKTIPVGDRTAVVIPAVWFVEVADPTQAEQLAQMRRHLVAHEALHVALRQRGEQTNDARSRLARSAAHGHFVASASVVGEEYRVQAALHAEGSTPFDDQDDLPEALVAACDAIIDGITLRYPDEPITRCWQTVTGAVHILAIRLGYLAAALRQPDGSVPAEPPPPSLRSHCGTGPSAPPGPPSPLPSACFPTRPGQPTRSTSTGPCSFSLTRSPIGSTTSASTCATLPRGCTSMYSATTSEERARLCAQSRQR